MNKKIVILEDRTIELIEIKVNQFLNNEKEKERYYDVDIKVTPDIEGTFYYTVILKQV